MVLCTQAKTDSIKKYMEIEKTPKRRSPFAGLAALVLGLLTGIVLMAIFAHIARTGVWNQVASLLTGREFKADSSLPAVIARMQKLQRLETVTFTMDKIVEGERTSPVLPSFLVGDKLLLVVHGEAIAGVDLGGLRADDIRVTGHTVAVKLPEPQLFVTRLDSNHTRVYSRTTGLLVSADPALESETRAQAEQQLREAAIAGGILNTARQNARSTVSAMLLGLGFEHAEVN